MSTQNILGSSMHNVCLFSFQQLERSAVHTKLFYFQKGIGNIFLQKLGIEYRAFKLYFPKQTKLVSSWKQRKTIESNFLIKEWKWG